MTLHSKTEVGRLADQLERSFFGGAWHGPATREALHGISAAEAERRLDGSPHTIVELVRHITFWLDAAYKRIIEGHDVAPDSDWPEEQALTDEAWTQAITELERTQAKLHNALIDLDDDRLDDSVSGSDPTVRGLLLGTLQHNAYHTGQIVQIKRELAK
jgi:uncharacterized damage-inducible protein DinB